MLVAAFLTRVASPPCRMWLLHQKASLGPLSAPRTAAGHQPIGSRRPRLGHARIWPTAIRVVEGLIGERERLLVLLQPTAPRQASQQRSSSPHRANLYSETPATALPAPPEHNVL